MCGDYLIMKIIYFRHFSSLVIDARNFVALNVLKVIAHLQPHIKMLKLDKVSVSETLTWLKFFEGQLTFSADVYMNKKKFRLALCVVCRNFGEFVFAFRNK